MVNHRKSLHKCTLRRKGLIHSGFKSRFLDSRSRHRLEALPVAHPGPRKGRSDTAFGGPRFVHPRERHRRNPFLNKDFRITSRYSFDSFVPFLDTATDDLDIHRFLARLTSNRVDVSPNAQHRLRAHQLPAVPGTFATNLSRNSPVSRRSALVLLYTIEARKPRGCRNFFGVPRRSR